MSNDSNLRGQPPIEPERYELQAPPAYHFELDRREFVKFFGTGLLVVGVMKPAAAQQGESGGGRQRGGRLPREISAWLHIGEDGRVTAYTGKVEIGQNTRTALTQAVAEELRVAVAKIEIVMGDTERVPYDAGTFGSQSTPVMNLQLRRVAAAARERLVELAAQKWQIDRAKLLAAEGAVSDATDGHTIEYGALVKDQQLTEAVPLDALLAPAADWKVAGTSISKVDGRAMVTGQHRFPSDQKLPDMLFGKILRPSAFGATLVSADTSAAEKIPGVQVVRDGEFIGVVAPSADAATQALARIRSQWKTEPQPSNKELFEYLKKNVEEGGERGERNSRNEAGSIEQGMAEAAHRLEQTYTVAYIAHTPLEPRVALAQWAGDNLTVWTATQRPFGVRSELAQTFRIPETQVRVLMPDMGSGYGGKHTGEAAMEAARLARAAKKPVQVLWTREEEFTWAYFRPAGVMEVRAGARADGAMTAWEFHNYNSGSSAIGTRYDIANQHIQFHRTQSPLRQGSYRGLAATANHFARETAMDELAHLLKMDPLTFRLKNLKDERMRAVLEAAAKQFGWGRARSAATRGAGISCGFEKGSYVASCAEVDVDRSSGAVKVVRVVTAFECGAVVNPEHLKNQIEGSVVMGLGGALFEAVEFANGRILNPHLASYRVPRFSDVPLLETVLVDRKDLPSVGAGETPIVGVAPAVGNAIFQASGVRLRSLPMVPNGLKK